MTASGFTLVVGALVVMLAFIKGVEEVCAVSGEAENVLVLAKGNSDEVMSRLDPVVASQVENARGIARDSAEQPLASRELFMVVHNQDKQTGAYRFLQLRGVVPAAFRVHTVVRLCNGQRFRPGQSEVIIGQAVQRETGLRVGDVLEVGRKPWKVNGVFQADGSALESEVWADLTEVASRFRSEGAYSSVVLRASGADAAVELAGRHTKHRTIPAPPM